MAKLRLFTKLSFVLAAFAMTPIAHSQSAQSQQIGTHASQKAKAPVPVAMTECEGVNNCATWTFLGAQGNGQWPSGEVANLTVERYDDNSVVIRRADSTGASAGLTAVYTGTRHGDRVGGDFTSSWPGHWENKSGNWYATVESPISPPEVMHFCAKNCGTLLWQSGHYEPVIKPSYCPPDWTSIWTVESFTRDLVILRRHDSPCAANPLSIPNGWDAVYTGKMSAEGNSLIFEKVDARQNDAIFVDPANLRLAWGSAINTVPGSNEERDRGRQPQQGTVVVPVVAAPVVCVPWFFGMVCAP